MSNNEIRLHKKHGCWYTAAGHAVRINMDCWDNQYTIRMKGNVTVEVLLEDQTLTYDRKGRQESYTIVFDGATGVIINITADMDNDLATCTPDVVGIPIGHEFAKYIRAEAEVKHDIVPSGV